MALETGWLKRQMETVERDISQWPVWMRREAGLLTEREQRVEKIHSLRHLFLTQLAEDRVNVSLFDHMVLNALNELEKKIVRG